MPVAAVDDRGGLPRSTWKATAQTVCRHARKMALEGIVSKRKDSPYCSGALA
jgi:ATP-dependent DNA ligase